jgi:hypothetical protein
MNKIIEYATEHQFLAVVVSTSTVFGLIVAWKLLRFFYRVINAIENVFTRRLQRWADKKADGDLYVHKGTQKLAKVQSPQKEIKSEIKQEAKPQKQEVATQKIAYTEDWDSFLNTCASLEIKTSPIVAPPSFSQEEQKKEKTRQKIIECEAKSIWHQMKFDGTPNLTVDQLKLLVAKGLCNSLMWNHISQGIAEFKNGNTVYKPGFEKFDPRRDSKWNGLTNNPNDMRL